VAAHTEISKIGESYRRFACPLQIADAVILTMLASQQSDIARHGSVFSKTVKMIGMPREDVKHGRAPCDEQSWIGWEAKTAFLLSNLPDHSDGATPAVEPAERRCGA
jgi:hypothetical protein